jgi:hypothetical protein
VAGRELVTIQLDNGAPGDWGAAEGGLVERGPADAGDSDAEARSERTAKE